MTFQHIKKYFLTLFTLFFASIIGMKAQTGSMVSGKIYSDTHETIEYATAILKNTPYRSRANNEGIYHINAPAGTYTLVVSAIGYKNHEQRITLTAGQRLKLNVSLSADTKLISEVVVMGGGVRRVNNSAYNAVAVDASKLKNTTMDIAHVLDRVSGVKLREDGGLGSSAQINLNGFTGKHVKIFMDGVPMEGAGSSFQINNIPITLAKQIEVYKGVVPVDFGGDALGGAVNIVTDKSAGTYVDASYSYGSFNTHKSSLNAGWTSRSGFRLQLSAYQNYSDNDYKVKTQYTDVNTGQVSKDEQWFRRFHDRYHNETVMAQAGIVGKRWADRLMVGMAWSHEYAQIQNANLMKIVFGGKLRKSHTLTPSLNYDKRNFFVSNLDFSLAARYNVVTTNNIDTASRSYSWTGAYRPKDTQGEGVATLAEFKGKTAYATANLRYRIGESHFFTLNNMYSNYVRRTTNSAANSVQQTAATFMRRKNVKDIVGLSYKYVGGEQWNVLAFGKYYNSHVRGPVNVATGSNRADYQEQARNVSATGYGAAATYYIVKGLQTKLSYEKTYRLPTEWELFGDGDYEEGDAALKPESSHNVNFNLSYMGNMGHWHSISAEAGMNYRGIGNYIIRTINTKGVAVSTNHGHVRGLGGDVSLRYYYKDVVTVGGNLSYQDMRDRERLTASGAQSVTYNNRVPNVPYFFGNGDASYTLRGLLGRGSTLTLGYALQYVHKFFRSWAGEGAKIYIPQQVSHDASITYSAVGGRYNISLEGNNLGNALLYDNYSLQKPGRSFSVKVRYFFYKRSQGGRNSSRRQHYK